MTDNPQQPPPGYNPPQFHPVGYNGPPSQPYINVTNYPAPTTQIFYLNDQQPGTVEGRRDTVFEQLIGCWSVLHSLCRLIRSH